MHIVVKRTKMIKIYYEVFMVVIMACILSGSSEENNEETKPGVEYMQIFRNIPALFEYFLDVLEQRVEILERDDVTTFQKDSQCENECEKNEVKREIDRHSFDTYNIIDDKNVEQIIENNVGYSGKYKRQINKDADDAYTTEIHEYGRSIGQYPNPNKKDFVETEESTNKILKREIIKSELIDRPYAKYLKELNNHNTNVKIYKNKNRPKRNVLQLENDFVGIDWSVLYLSSEEVEEKAIRTEQIIEDYKKKNTKK